MTVNGHSTYPIMRMPLWQRLVLRTLDIILGSFFLLLSAPIIVLAMLAIRLESKGNPLFSQDRVGWGGKIFRIFKLRGMYSDARERYPDLYDYQKFGTLGFYFHYENDPRVTRVGGFIRRTSIDELPNFFNVVMGEMTLVGPRPEVPEVQAMYGQYAAKYLSVKPGITCLSKISGRDHLTKEESILLDLDYVDRMSLRMNAKILWLTAKAVLMRKHVFSGRLASLPKTNDFSSVKPLAPSLVNETLAVPVIASRHPGAGVSPERSKSNPDFRL